MRIISQPLEFSLFDFVKQSEKLFKFLERFRCLTRCLALLPPLLYLWKKMRRKGEVEYIVREELLGRLV